MMENVLHLWNLTSAIVKSESPGVNNLRNHYIQCCRDFRDVIELPNNIFGSGTMCSKCGSLWRSVNTTVRLIKARHPLRSIERLIRQSNGASDLSKFKKKLIDKCTKNRGNKILITCSICHEKTTINLRKPKRVKLMREEHQLPKSSAKKKKRKKDKTAGLIINPKTTDKTFDSRKSTTPILKKSQVKVAKKLTNFTPKPPKKINISKLKGMIDTTVTPGKRHSLQSFLTELG